MPCMSCMVKKLACSFASFFAALPTDRQVCVKAFEPHLTSPKGEELHTALDF